MDERSLHSAIADHLFALPANDPVRISELMLHLHGIREPIYGVEQGGDPTENQLGFMPLSQSQTLNARPISVSIGSHRDGGRSPAAARIVYYLVFSAKKRIRGEVGPNAGGSRNPTAHVLS
jgi:hypothetical protein